MRKLLLLLLTLIAFVPQLRADWKDDFANRYRTENIWTKSTGATTNGTLKVYYYVVAKDEARTIGTELKCAEMTAEEYLGSAYSNYDIVNKIERIEYQPNGSKDVLIFTFSGAEDVPDSYISTGTTNFNKYQKDVKVGAYFTGGYGFSLQPGTKVNVTTKYKGSLASIALKASGATNAYLNYLAPIDGYFAFPDAIYQYTFSDTGAKAGGDVNNPAHQTFRLSNTYTATKQNAQFILRFPQNTTGSSPYCCWLNDCNFHIPTTYTQYAWFNSIDVEWVEGIPPTPMVPAVDIDINNGYEENDIIYYSHQLNVSAAFNKDEVLPENVCKIKYHISATPENIDYANDLDLVLADGKYVMPSINKVSDKYLQVYAFYPVIETVSPIVTKVLNKVDNVAFGNLADAQKEEYNNRPVIFSCPLLIEGIENTQNNAKFMYVRDPQGNAIKFVNNGSEIFFNESTHYQPGQEIPAYGITGVYRHNEGWPQIEVYVGPGEDYRAYSIDANSTPAGTYTAYNPARKTFGEADFNRHVIVDGLKWTGSESRFVDSEGNSLNAYGRFTAYQGILGGLTEGKEYTVEGFIGQIKGVPTIFPTKVDGGIVLLAPNPITGDKDSNGYIHVNVISDEVSITLDQDSKIEDAKYFVQRNDDEPYEWVNTSGFLTIKANQFNRDNEYRVIVSAQVDGKTVSEIKILFTKHEVTKEYDSIAEFNTEFRDAASLPAVGSNKMKYYRFTGNAEVRAITPKYLYLRDANCAEGEESMASLLLYNENGWNGEVATVRGEAGGAPAVGDILTNFVLIPDRTSLGNLRGYATNFARTLRRVSAGEEGQTYTPKSFEAASGKEFDNNDRMVRYIVENVKVKRESNNGAITYTLDMPGNPVLNIGDVFEVTAGWATAWDPNTAFNIEGIVLRNGDSGYALAFYGFTTGAQTPALAVPTLQGVADTDLTSGLSFATTAKVVLALADADSDPSGDIHIYYTIDGSDPLNNPDKRIEYTAPFEISATTTVKAYAAAAGMMPSDVTERTFTRTTSDRRYIINFLNQGQPNEMYNFTGTVAVAAIGNEYMFVRGSVGHYLPVKLTAEGATWADKGYKTGDHLTGFMLGYHEEGTGKAVNRMGRVADAATLATWGTAITPDANETITVNNPETVASISTDNLRRMVTVKGATIAAGSARAASWHMTDARGEGNSYDLVTSVFNPDMSAVTGDNQLFDITGFVMYGTDGSLELWPMSISRLTPAANVAILVNSLPAPETAEFTATAKIELTCSTPGAAIEYQFYDENIDKEPTSWYTYQGHPIIIDSTCRLHARASAPGFDVSGHSHVNLVRLDQTAAPVITVAEGADKTTVTIEAETGSVIKWWTSEDAAEQVYSGPITVTSTVIVYASAKVSGKAESPVAHKLAKVAATPAQPENRSGKVIFTSTLKDNGMHEVTITPEDATLTPGSYKIYYTTTEGTVLTPESGIEYSGAFEFEGGVIYAILVENGKSAGETCHINLWALPTGIDGIESTDSNGIRVEGSSIIAPAGSEVYDLNGRRVNASGLASGIYIVRTPAGKTAKVRI